MNYLSRIHREEVRTADTSDGNALMPCVRSLLFPSSQDFDFVLKGLARLLNNPLTQTYLPNSTKKIQFHQELLVLFWKLCDFNKVWKADPPEADVSLGACSFISFSLPRNRNSSSSS